MNRSWVIGFAFLFLICACTPGQAGFYQDTYPGNLGDAQYIHRAQEGPLTLAVYGGKLEPYNGADWYLSSGFKTLLNVLIELDEPEEGERWLESLSIDVDVDIPGSSFQFLNSSGSQWELASKDRNIRWVSLLGEIQTDPNLTDRTAIITLTGEVSFREREQGLFRRAKTRTAHIDEDITVPIRPFE